MMIDGGNPASLAAPIGPFRHFTVAPDEHRLVFVSGQVGHNASGELVSGGCFGQTRQVFRNLDAILLDLGATPQHVVKLFTIVTGEGSFAEFARARQEVFARWYPTGDYPAHSAFSAAALAAPELLIELEAVVAVPR